MSYVNTFSRFGPNKAEWWVPAIHILFRCSELTIMSPKIWLQDSIWCLVLNYPLGFEDEVWIYLCRRDYGSPKRIKYTIKTHLRNEVIEVSRTHYFAGRNTNSEKIKLSTKKINSSEVLITCCITEPPLDIGTEEGFATSADQQKNLPNCISRAIQTEVENSVIEKEIPKDVTLLSERMKELLNKSNDHDITIRVQDKKFRAHRSILSIRSPVFAMMLGEDTKENNTSIIDIEDCDPESFDEFLLYVYSGRTENLTLSNALQLYYSADKYDFPVLKERCVSLLKTSVSVESFCDVVLLAAKHREEELLKVAAEFFARNMKKILITVAWQKFMAQNPVEANELMIKSVNINHPEN